MRQIGTAGIRDGLAGLGLGPGSRLMLHSSLSSFGHVRGGASAVIEAVMQLVEPDGTIVMPSFNHGRPFAPDGSGVFDPRSTPTGNGRIPDCFWRLPGVFRSLNPTHPFAAWGRDAERYTRDHHLTLTMGPGSPLGMLALEGGIQVNLGTGHGTTTAKHLAETMRGVPCLGRRTEAYPVRLPDGRTVEHRTWGWRERACPLTESGRFIEAGMRGRQRCGFIGACPVTVFAMRDLLEVVWELLDHGHAGLPGCASCPIRPRQVGATCPSDWAGNACPALP